MDRLIRLAQKKVGFCVDSRTIKQGEVFFALPGKRIDGHCYLDEVESKGAIAAVVLNHYAGKHSKLELIRVENVLDALQQLAQQIISERCVRTAAVTGSIGKTTTKDFIGALLRQKYRVGVSPGNNNSQVGLPLAILNHTSGDEEIIVFEMGMTHPGNIAKLVGIVQPEISVITAIELVHACNFDKGSELEALAEIARAKGEILLHPKTQLGLIHRDINNFNELCALGSCKKMSFSIFRSESDYFLRSAGDHIELITSDETEVLGSLTLRGKHNQHNFLAAVAVARYFRLGWDEIRRGMKTLVLPERRLQKIEKDGVIFINDSYNACVASIKAALESMPQPGSNGRKIAVIGEMLELGKFSDKCHQEVGKAALNSVEKLFALGQGCEPMQRLWREEGRSVEWTLSRAELVGKLRNELREGDVVLLKGSQANLLWKVLEEL